MHLVENLKKMRSTQEEEEEELEEAEATTLQAPRDRGEQRAALHDFLVWRVATRMTTRRGGVCVCCVCVCVCVCVGAHVLLFVYI